MDNVQISNDRLYTVDDYIKLDDQNRYELIDGELLMVPRPRPAHQKIVLKIAAALYDYLQQHPGGEVLHDVDVHLGENIVAPDVFFVSRERIGIIGEQYVTGAPDLVIEVLSPATAAFDRKRKSHIYHAAGVKEYWLVDPETKLVEVLTAGEKGWFLTGVYDEKDVLTSPLLPGLQIEVGKIFTR